MKVSLSLRTKAFVCCVVATSTVAATGAVIHLGPIRSPGLVRVVAPVAGDPIAPAKAESARLADLVAFSFQAGTPIPFDAQTVPKYLGYVAVFQGTTEDKLRERHEELYRGLIQAANAAGTAAFDLRSKIATVDTEISNRVTELGTQPTQKRRRQIETELEALRSTKLQHERNLRFKDAQLNELHTQIRQFATRFWSSGQPTWTAETATAAGSYPADAPDASFWVLNTKLDEVALAIQAILGQDGVDSGLWTAFGKATAVATDDTAENCIQRLDGYSELSQQLTLLNTTLGGKRYGKAQKGFDDDLKNLNAYAKGLVDQALATTIEYQVDGPATGMMAVLDADKKVLIELLSRPTRDEAWLNDAKGATKKGRENCAKGTSLLNAVNRLVTAGGAAASASSTGLRDTIKSLLRDIARTSVEFGPENDDTVSANVRLFYAVDPVTVARTLRAGEEPESINPGVPGAEEAAVRTRTTLTKLEGDLFQAEAERNDLQSRIQNIKNEIKAVTAEFNRSQRDSTQISRQVEDNDKKTKKATAAALKAGEDVTKAQDEVNNAQAALDTASTDEEKVRAKENLDRKKQALDRAQRIKQVRDREEADAQAEGEALGRQQEDVTASHTEVKARRDKLMDEQTGLPAKLGLAESKLEETIGKIRKAVVDRRPAADLEAEAFGRFAQQEPALAYGGVASASPPAHRVRMVVFPRSKTIYLRGNRDDVHKVKEMIALFDRPTPQARIVLHTLQVDSNNPRKLDAAISQVNDAMRGAKADMAEVQNSLRNSLTREVERVQRAIEMVYPDVDDRVARSYLYNEVVRHELGIVLDANDADFKRKYCLARAAVQIQEASQALANAMESNQSALDSKDRRARHVSNWLRRQWATRAGYLLARGMKFAYESGVSSKSLEALDSRIPKAMLVSTEIRRMIRQNETDPEKYIAALADKFGKDEPDKELLKVAKKIHDHLKCIVDSKATSLPPRLMKSQALLARITVPEPAKGTTLGEMLFVISLGTEFSREQILHDMGEELFLKMSTDRARTSRVEKSKGDLLKFATALVSEFGNQALSIEDHRLIGRNPLPTFPATVFGANQLSSSVVAGNGAVEDIVPHSSDAVTSNQREIMYGLKTKLRRNIANIMETLVEDKFGASRPYSPSLGSSRMELQHALYKYALTLMNMDNASDANTAKWLNAELAQAPTPQADKDGPIVVDRLRDISDLSTATPRVAAADQMIKRLVESFELDFDNYFIDPMLDEIRRATSGTGIGFGSYERKSILASNRLIARVDTVGSGSLQDPADQNLLGEAKTLADLVTTLSPKRGAAGAARSRGGIAESATDAGLGAYLAKQSVKGATESTVGLGAAAGLLLSSLMSLPEDAPGEVYSLNTGGLFKVTPIFDPSGQGLRFRFDYAQTTNVLEPNGTVNMQSSRVDRHTVNTDVHITNLDLMEISRFESNLKVGRASRQSGGIPILRDLLPTVPLIGWFVKSRDSKPVRQQSLMFAQTAMYPTVGDIMDLLVDYPVVGKWETTP